MPDEPRPVDIHELVYGSAARLLDPGATDLGVIASTRDFPPDVARRLAAHRGFTRDGNADGAGKYVVGVVAGRLEFTRIQMGTDHTGRTIPFARHLLLPLDGGNRWSDLVARAAAHSRDPRQATAGWIEPAPRLAPVKPAPAPGEPLAKAIAAAAETVMHYPETKRPVLLVHAPAASPEPGADPFLGIIAAIGDVLPRSALPALVAATHAVDPDDRLAEASVLATYPGTAFHREMTGRTGSRRPLIIDVARGTVDGAATPPSAFVKATVADLVAGRPGRFAALCDRLGAKADHWPLVAELDKALAAATAQPGLATMQAFVLAAKKAGGATAGSALDRRAVTGLVVETIGAALGALARDAAGQADGAATLGELLGTDEKLTVAAARVGIAACQKGARREAGVLATVLRDMGEETIAVVRKLAGNQPAGLELLRQIEQVGVQLPVQERAPSEAATVKEKPKPVAGAAGSSRVRNHANVGGGRGAAAAGGMPWWLRIVMLVLFTPALFGVAAPVRRAYEPPPVDAVQKDSRDGKRGSRVDAAHREAFWKAVTKARPALPLPGILCLVALALLLLNGVLTRLSFNSLHRVCGAVVATYLPAVALLAVSASGWYLGQHPEAEATSKAAASKQEDQDRRQTERRQDDPPKHDGESTTEPQGAAPAGTGTVKDASSAEPSS